MCDLQSIKIYFNDKKINLKQIIPSDLKNYNQESDSFYIHTNKEKLSAVLDHFFNNEILEEITIGTDDFDKLFIDFKTNFVYIEAAGGIVMNNKKQMLIIHRFGIPDLPKGKVESGENTLDAAVREVEEECGITDLKIINESDSSFHIYLNKGKLVLKKTYWYHMEYFGNEKLIPQEKESITKAEWCDKALLSEYKLKTYLSLRTYFKLSD